MTSKIDENNAALERDYQLRKNAQQNLAVNMSRISPASALTFGSMTLARTGIDEYDRFLAPSRIYKPIYTKWVNSKLGQSINLQTGQQTNIKIDDMPQFAIERESLAKSLARTLPDYRPDGRHDHRLLRRRLRLVPALRRPLRSVTMLEAINLTKRYEDGQLALDNLTFKVEPGEIFCMFGANGAGKTTTINLFLNFIPPTSGTALIEGVDVAKDPLKAKRHVSFVSENVMLYGNFTAVQNLDYFSRLAGKRTLTKKDYAERAEPRRTPEGCFRQRIKNFSKGMRQKLGIAIALLKDAPNVLLDEPTSGLDPQSGREFLEILVQMRDQGKSVFMSTHDIFRAKLIADRIGFMRKGQLVMLKTAERARQART